MTLDRALVFLGGFCAKEYASRSIATCGNSASMPAATKFTERRIGPASEPSSATMASSAGLLHLLHPPHTRETVLAAEGMGRNGKSSVGHSLLVVHVGDGEHGGVFVDARAEEELGLRQQVPTPQPASRLINGMLGAHGLRLTFAGLDQTSRAGSRLCKSLWGRSLSDRGSPVRARTSAGAPCAALAGRWHRGRKSR